MAEERSSRGVGYGLIAALPYSFGVVGIADERETRIRKVDGLKFSNDLQCKAKRITDSVYALISGCKTSCNTAILEIDKKISIMEDNTKFKVDLNSLERMMMDGVVSIVQKDLGEKGGIVEIIFIGQTQAKEQCAFKVFITETNCSTTWMMTFAERSVAENMGFNPFGKEKSLYLMTGSGSPSARSALMSLSGRETAKEIQAKILVAANDATLEVATVGGAFSVLTFYHGEPGPIIKVFPPVRLQLADSGSFNRVLLVRIPVTACPNTISQDRIMPFLENNQFEEDGVLCSTYFLTTTMFRFWRLLTGNEGAAVVLERIKKRLGEGGPRNDGYYTIVVPFFNGEVGVARCNEATLNDISDYPRQRI